MVAYVLLTLAGPDDALIECGVFGPGVIQSVLNGNHYVRAVTSLVCFSTPTWLAAAILDVFIVVLVAVWLTSSSVICYV